MINKYTNQSQTQKNIQAQKIKFISKKQEYIFFVTKYEAMLISNQKA